MNYHSDEWIMDRVREHYNEALEHFPEDRIVGIFYRNALFITLPQICPSAPL